MQWGRKWGNQWGYDSIPDNELEITDLQNVPPEVVLSWPATGTNSLYHVYVDGKFYRYTNATKIVVQLLNYGRHFFNVLLGGPNSTEEDLTLFVEATPGGRAKLSWMASTSTDVDHYEIYWDSGTGGAMAYLDETELTEWISEELDNGTYVFRVDPVDDAGNKRTSSFTVSVTIAKYPNPPSALILDSYNEQLNVANFTFTESETPPTITGYRVYHNSGSGYIDYDTVIATVPYGSGSFSLVLNSAGSWKVALRAYNSLYEENNVDVYEEFVLSGSPLDLLEDQPNIPTGLVVDAASAGTFSLKCNYISSGEIAKATEVNFYANNGLGGEINFTIPIATGVVAGHELGESSIIEILATSTAMVDGRTYTFACKASSITGRESDQSEETTAVCDATIPDDISGLSGEAVNYAE